MGILSRFKDIMASNINSWRDSKKHSEKEIRKQIEALQRDLGAIDAEFNAYESAAIRTEKAYAEAKAEVAKFEKYVARATEEGDAAAAADFQVKLDAANNALEAAGEKAKKAATEFNQMKQMKAKRTNDIATLQGDLGGELGEQKQYLEDIQNAKASLGKTEADEELENLMKKYDEQ